MFIYSCKNPNNPLVIAGFPGIGKSYLYNNNTYGYKIYDSDSSKFPKDENWPNNYLDYITNIIEKADELTIILTSTHKEVLQGLISRNIKFIIVSPMEYNNIKMNFINRYKSRGSNEKFIDFMNNNWSKFMKDIDEINNSSVLCDHITIGSYKYLEDIINKYYYNENCFTNSFYPFNFKSVSKKMSFIIKCLKSIDLRQENIVFNFNPYNLVEEYKNILSDRVFITFEFIALKGKVDKLELLLKGFKLFE